MNAWMRLGWTGCGVLAGLWLVGCRSSDTPKKVSTAEQAPVSMVPSWDAEAVQEARPAEILPATHAAAGRLHEGQGHLARAAEQYRLAIGLDPQNLEAINRLGIVLDRLGRFREADDMFVRALALAPGQAYLHNNLAFSYIMQARWREAEVALRQALEIEPDFARASVNLGMVLAQQERFEEAREEFQAALRPEDARYNMGLMFQSRKYPAEAAREYMAALELNPKMVAAGNRLAKLPPEAVSAAEAELEALRIADAAEAAAVHEAMTASPAPEQPAESPETGMTERPAAPPADLPPVDAMFDGIQPEPADTAVDVPKELEEAVVVPESISLSIEAERWLNPSIELEEGQDLLWLPADLDAAPIELVGPPLEAADGSGGEISDEASPSQPDALSSARAMIRMRARRVVAVVRSMAMPLERLFGPPSSEPWTASHASSPRPPSLGGPKETRPLPAGPLLSPVPEP